MHNDQDVEFDTEDDFGFSTIDAIEVKNTAELETKIVDLESRLERVRTMTLPLIHNLMRDPDKDIHWPDRDSKLGDFEKRFLAALSGEEEPKKKRKKSVDAE